MAHDGDGDDNDGDNGNDQAGKTCGANSTQNYFLKYAAKVKTELQAHIRRHKGEKPYICNICSKKFTTKSDCNTHKKSHDVSKEIMKCQLCRKEVTKRSLKLHMKFKHTGSPSETHECEKCDKCFVYKKGLMNHMRHQHDNYKQFVCSVCKKRFNQKVHLKTHMMSHTGEKPFKCLYCESTFRDLHPMKIHQKRIHETQKYSYKCENCQGSFKTHVDKRHHIVCRLFIYSGTSIICKICQEYQSKNTIIPHSKHHLTDAETYKCDFCDKRFIQNSNKTTHENNIHKKLNRLVCRICYKGFSQRIGLDNHIKATHQEREFKCKICSSSFILEDKLTIHAAYHDMKRPFSCGVCHWRFSRNITMKHHVKTYHKEKTHKCDNCASSFILQEHLHSHQKLHDKDRKFECNLCHQRYPTKASLTFHTKNTHIKMDKLPCSNCEKKFKHRDSLRKHNDEQHDSTKGLFQCLQCPYSSKRSDSLKVHTEGVHSLI